jgi:hypothetical protein
MSINKIDKVRWVQRTMEKMQDKNSDDKQLWNACWLEAYIEIGGKSENTGSKPCPKAAAYGLWYLGHIVGSERTQQNWPLAKIRKYLGKNAAYAVLALGLLENKYDGSVQALWQEVQSLYQQKLLEKPADSEQGEIALTMLLYKENLITA